jgi:hypothetical protein
LWLFFKPLANTHFQNKRIRFKVNNRVAHKLPDIFGNVPNLWLFFKPLANTHFQNKRIIFKVNNRVAHKLPDIFLWQKPSANATRRS